MSHIIIGFYFFLLMLFSFITFSRIFKKLSPAFILCLNSLIIYFIGLSSLTALQIPLMFFKFSASYWFFSFSTMMLFFAIYKSISLRIMLSLSNKPNTLNQILNNYIKHDSYKTRLNILLKKGLAAKTNNGYALTIKGRKYAKLITTIQKIFNIYISG